MKKILPSLLIFILFFTIADAVFAQSAEDVIGRITPPREVGEVGSGTIGLTTIIQRVIQIIYIIGTLGFLFMLLWSGLQMILNAGDKEATGNARKRITTAIIGITLLALAFPIMKVLEEIIGIKFFF